MACPTVQDFGVPVFVGDMKSLAADKPGAVSVFYAVENKDGAFRPGQRVGVALPMLGDETSLAAPKAALIWDIHGGTWVYEKVGDHAYARRRVMVDRVVGELAVLASGPKVGSKVVTDGAAEIHGAEFGNGK